MIDAWTTTFSPDMTHIVFAQIGIQSKQNNDTTEIFQMVKESFSLSNGPKHFDISIFTDSESYTNNLFMAYWDDPGQYHAWLSHPQVQEWWSGDLLDENSEIGLFKEVATIPVTHFETIHQRYNNDSGITHFTQLEKTDVHAYWGSMRDRMQTTAEDNLDVNDDTNLSLQDGKQTLRRRVKVKDPGQVCLIRTAQDWSHCSEEEKKTYLDLVHPTLEKGHDFLDHHPEESGCISAKLLQEVDDHGDNLEKTCVVGFFRSLKDLEEWTHNHATHKAIFGAFLEMLQRHNLDVGLSLWHEVSVLQSEDLELEYVNCHAKTGFLPYFETTEMEALPES